MVCQYYNLSSAGGRGGLLKRLTSPDNAWQFLTGTYVTGINERRIFGDA